MLCLAFASAAHAEVVDRLVAVVGAELVLASDIALDAELADVDPSTLPFWRRGQPDARQIAAAVIRTAAGDIGLYRPSEEAVRERVLAVRDAFVQRHVAREGRAEDWDAFLARWGLDEETFAPILRRRLIVEAYLARNLKSSVDDPAWGAECDALVAQLTTRVRVRIAPGAAP